MVTTTPSAASAGSDRVPGRQGPRFGVLDGLRFAAAAAVLAYHFTARSSRAWGTTPDQVFPTLHRYSAWGAYGVELFFIISGFVILMTAWGRSPSHFAASRIGRLFPAYWVAVLLTSVLLLFLWPESGKQLTVPQIAANLTMVHPAFGIPHVDGVYWTLWAELRFYALIGVLSAIGITTRRMIVVIMIWAPLAGIARLGDSELVSTLLIADQAPLFAGGMALFMLSRHPRSAILWIALVENVLLAIAVPGQITAGQVAENTGVELRGAAVALTIVVCFALVAVAVLTPVRHISWRWLTLVGALTYPLYLVHEYWGWWIISLVHPHVSTPLTLLIATVAVLVLAWVIHRCVERPIGPRLRALVQRSIDALGHPEAGRRQG